MDAADTNRLWNVVVTADYGCDAVKEHHHTLMQVRALDSRVMLTFHDTRCRAEFLVRANDMTRALRAAMARWARVTETARLPWWDVTTINVLHHDGECCNRSAR